MTIFCFEQIIAFYQAFGCGIRPIALCGMTDAQCRTYLTGVVKSFVNEIKIMESLKGHPNIVSVEDYKVIEDADDMRFDIYIKMELLKPFNEYVSKKS